MSYCGYITRIKDVRSHTNADRLQVATVFGNDVIVGLNTQVGDIGVYFPTDGKLGLEYAKINKLLREKDMDGKQTGGYLEPEKRHIRAIKLRGEKSDGLFMPIESLSSFYNIKKLNEGDTITTLDGILICEKYIPKGKNKNNQNNQPKTKKNPKELFPYFAEHVDTSQLTYNINNFKEGDLCYITLKTHGTSQRTANAIKKKKGILHNVKKYIGIKPKLKNKWEYVTGTRRVILKNFDGGFYGDNNFRKQWHDFFDGKLQKGESVYYEVVGYAKENKTIMPEGNNEKTKDKNFIKQYGDTTRFTYGCGIGESNIYVYRMTMTNEDGHTVEYPTELVKLRCEQMAVDFVPVLDKFIFTDQDDLMDRVNMYEDGADPIGKTHVREGIVVRIDNREKFAAFKHKNWNFKVLESIIKVDDILDMEEAENINEGEG